jgi:hypothetical protein
MHYANGRVAKLGDLVRGKGYSVKHEIIGKVVNLRAGDSCNLSIAHVDAGSACFIAADGDLNPCSVEAPFCSVVVNASIEHGETKSFVALDPFTGDVLLPAGLSA